MCLVEGSRRSNLQTWIPSISGSIRSKITRSGFALRSLRNASGPSFASTALKPAAFRLYSTNSAAYGSSSTTRIVFFVVSGLIAAVILTFFSGMSDILCFVNINHLLGDIRRVIRNAFEAFGNDHQIQRARNRRRVLDHETGQLAMQLLVDAVDFLVARDNRARAIRRPLHKRIERIFQHLQPDA